MTSFIGDGVMRRDGSAGLSDMDICRANRINPVSFLAPFPFTFWTDTRGRKGKNVEAELLSLSKTSGSSGTKINWLVNLPNSVLDESFWWFYDARWTPVVKGLYQQKLQPQ